MGKLHMGMLSKLYAYRERPNVSPLENFLTEAFADFFRRSPLDLKRSLVLTLLPASAREAFIGAVQAAKDLAIRTQVTAWSSGSPIRPDLVLDADGRNLLLVEAKIGAGFRHHAIGRALGGDDDEKVGDQLETYARWVSAGEGPGDGWPGAVVLLTAYTDPPKDFVEGRADGVFRSTRRWKDVGEWILREIPVSEEHVAHCAIAAELYRFLSERNLMTRYIAAQDIAAASLFAKSEAVFQQTFLEVLKAMGSHAPKLRGGSQYGAGFWSEGRIFWGWYNFAKSIQPASSLPYVAVGICFEVAEVYAADIGKLPRHEPFFFVSCADGWGGEKPTKFLTAIPEGWSEIGKDMVAVAARAVRDFPADPDERVAELKAWAIEQVDRLVARVPGYVSAPLEAVATGTSREDGPLAPST